MIDVKFKEAMNPLAKALQEKLFDIPKCEPGPIYTRAAAAVVEALGIPAQMVADKNFRAQLLLLVDACKTDPDTTPTAVDNARDALERVFYWLGMGDEGPEASLPLPSEVSEDKGVGELLEQVRLAARGLGGLQEEDEADTLPAIRSDEPEAVTEPGGPEFASATCSKSEPCPACISAGAVPGKGFSQDGDDPMRAELEPPVVIGSGNAT